MNPDDLIRIAEHLASGGVRGRIGRPVQAELRRAVSATYYALFHALARCCANMLVGVQRLPAEANRLGVRFTVPLNMDTPRISAQTR